MSPGEMRVVLLILASLIADSTASDPCVTHTVLDQPWRNSGCHRTRCSSRWMDDGNLTEGWYRFSSYDNVKILEHAVPFSRCSGWSPGWLSGSHPRVRDGEVTRTVCFNWVRDNPNKHNCLTHQEIKIKNCGDYFVYRLKPTPGYYSVYCTDSVRSDPCVDHTVLDQPWRSTDCSNTQCTNGQWKSDENLVEGWYRFNSSGGWKIPETNVPANHCSGMSPGWLNGDHPSVTDGEVTREVCFEDVGGGGSGEECKDIKVKNCSSYFVYELKPTHIDQSVYCTAADSALGDPCVNHTVLDQPWRSTGCTHTECSSGQWQNDEKHGVGWYRFKSSGGWKIPETDVPTYHCSGTSTGWLNGPHPSEGDGEVTRTVCFTWDGNGCNRQHEIKVKRCGGFFVYRLEPTLCCNKVYCTDPHSVPTGEPQETTAQPQEDLSTVPEPGTSSDLQLSTGEQTDGSTTGESTQESSFDPMGDTSSDPHSVPTGEPQETTAQPQEDLSTVPEPGTSSDLQLSTGEQTDGSTTGESTQESSFDPKGDTSSDPHSVPTGEPQETTTQPQEDLSTIPEPGTSSDHQMSTGKQIQESSTGESTQEPSSVPVGDTSSDPHSVPTGESQETTAQPQEDLSKVPEPDTSSDPPLGTTQEPQGATSGDSGQGSTSDPAGSASSGPEGAGPEAHKTSTTREPSGTPSSAPKEETCSAHWLLTEEECERLISEAQVLFIGDQGSPEDMKAHLQELREILRKQL
ncbi:uncharacterized protein LOC116975639 [Amblyraja radiata]|uniref:uncharacterized protein LOC116975639 n=1 Tax=Amblyraja radiata TaxID=386614 RepID=UPI001403406D|nr:uncharacterized protein LOC116975639 [Amblyraja radiata]